MTTMLSGQWPQWCVPLEVVSVDDLCRQGACRDGVREWLDRRRLNVTVLSVDSKAIAKDNGARIRVAAAAALSGSGSGYGYGYGSGVVTANAD
jgi:hypothetical protein